MRYGQHLARCMTQSVNNVTINNSCKYDDIMVIIVSSSITITSTFNLIDHGCLEHCDEIIQKHLLGALAKNTVMDANAMVDRRRR